MIDGIKFSIYGNLERIRDNDLLKFKPNGSRHTAKYNKCLHFDLYPEKCSVHGSLHKYKNLGEHNADDFTLPELAEVFNDLSVKFGINPQTTTFSRVEFGVNVRLPFDPQRFIKSVVLYHDKRTKDVLHTKYGIEITFADYQIKIYIKSDQTPQFRGMNILRFEVEISRVRRIREQILNDNTTIVTTLSDLATPVLWSDFGCELLRIYDNLIVAEYDTVDIPQLIKDGILKDKDANILINGHNAGYWLNQSGMQKTRNMERFETLIAEHSSSTLKNDVRKLVLEKINQLKNVTNSTTVEKSEKAKMLPIPNLDDCRNSSHFAPEKSVCKITGLSLQFQKKHKGYLSPSAVEFYHQNEPAIYFEKLYPRLGERWKNDSLKIHYREIAHSIRNENFNKDNNARNHYKQKIARRTEYPLLFSLAENLSTDAKTKYEKWIVDLPDKNQTDEID